MHHILHFFLHDFAVMVSWFSTHLSQLFLMCTQHSKKILQNGFTQTCRTLGCSSNTHICSLLVWSRVRVVDTRVRGLLEVVSWPCVGAQVNDGSHVKVWTACKRTHNQYETSCGFRPHPRECLYASGIVISLSIEPNYQYQYKHMRVIFERFLTHPCKLSTQLSNNQYI